MLHPVGILLVDVSAAVSLAAGAGLDTNAFAVGATRTSLLDDPVDASLGGAQTLGAPGAVACWHADLEGAVVALRAAGETDARVAVHGAGTVVITAIRRRAVGRYAGVGPAVFAIGTTRGAGTDASVTAAAVARRIVTEPRLCDAGLIAAVHPPVGVLALIAGRADVAFAAEDRGKSSDALPAEATQTGLAVAGGAALGLRLASAAATGVRLALLTDRAEVALAAVDRGDSGDALAVDAAEAGRAVAGGAALALADIQLAIGGLAAVSSRTPVTIAAEDGRVTFSTVAIGAAHAVRAIAGAVAGDFDRYTDFGGAVVAGWATRDTDAGAALRAALTVYRGRAVAAGGDRLAAHSIRVARQRRGRR